MAAMPFDAQNPLQREHYSRQIRLPEMGLDGQAALARARVLVVGAGALGAPVIAYLAAAGVGTLVIADGDRVEPSNLPRQVLFPLDAVGQPKASVAAARVRALNPEVMAIALERDVKADNAAALVAESDLVVDASDNFPTRFLLNDACRLAGKPLIHGALQRFTGQLTTFLPDRGPCYRCFFPEPPAKGLVPGCAEVGVLGPVPGVLGSYQALEAIKVLIGALEATLCGSLMLVDLWNGQQERLALPRDPNCPLCGEEPLITSLLPDYDRLRPL
ncbi:MAG TPA: HesA/MoeB/ThiF family protein [Oscillatoriaceae cyanobacterium]